MRRVTLSCYIEAPLFIHGRQLSFVFLLCNTADLSLRTRLINSVHIGIRTKVRRIYVCRAKQLNCYQNPAKAPRAMTLQPDSRRFVFLDWTEKVLFVFIIAENIIRVIHVTEGLPSLITRTSITLNTRTYLATRTYEQRGTSLLQLEEWSADLSRKNQCPRLLHVPD